MALYFRRQRRARRWLLAYPRALPLALFLIISAIMFLSVQAIERGADERNLAELRGRMAAIGGAMERRGNAAAAYLRAGSAMFSMMEEVPPSDFDRFVSELRLDSESEVGYGLGWAKLIRRGDENAFNQMLAANSANAPAPRMRPQLAGEQAHAVAVTYLYPDSVPNQRAIGFDMYSEPVRRAAMNRAISSQRPTASGRVVLAQDVDDPRPGFLIYMPVFGGNPRQQQLKGFIYIPFNADDFLASALDLGRPGPFGARLYDGLNESPAALLASTNEGPEARRESVSDRIIIGHRPFLLVVSRTAAPGLTDLSMATLVFGLLAGGLLMTVAVMLIQQAQEDEAKVVWFEQQASIRDSLTRELNHRVKNTLANVLSIITLTRRRANDIDEFVDGLDGRIRAICAAHDLLTESDWGSTPVRALIEVELMPYALAGEQQVLIEGPDVELAPSDALSLALAIHELASNALRYGALSQEGGQVSVSWQYQSAESIEVEWLERGGPPVPEMRARGFGTELIERVVAQELRSPVKLDFEPEGVRCTFYVAVRSSTRFELRAGQAAKSPPPGML